MRTVVVKVVVIDDDSGLEAETIATENQINTLDKFNIDLIAKLVPQLNKELSKKIENEENDN